MTLSLPLTQVQEIFVYAFMRIKGWWHNIMEHLIVSLFKWRKNETLFKKIKSKYDAHFRKTSNLIWLGIFVTFRSVEPLCHYYRLRSGVPSPILNRPQYQIPTRSVEFQVVWIFVSDRLGDISWLTGRVFRAAICYQCFSTKITKFGIFLSMS